MLKGLDSGSGSFTSARVLRTNKTCDYAFQVFIVRINILNQTGKNHFMIIVVTMSKCTAKYLLGLWESLF